MIPESLSEARYPSPDAVSRTQKARGLGAAGSSSPWQWLDSSRLLLSQLRGPLEVRRRCRVLKAARGAAAAAETER